MANHDARPGSAAGGAAGKLWANVFSQEFVQYQAAVRGHQFVSPHDTGVLAESERPALVEQVNQSRLLMGAGQVRARVRVGDDPVASTGCVRAAGLAGHHALRSTALAVLAT